MAWMELYSTFYWTIRTNIPDGAKQIIPLMYIFLSLPYFSNPIISSLSIIVGLEKLVQCYIWDTYNWSIFSKYCKLGVN